MGQKREKVKNRVQLEMGAASKSGEGLKHQGWKQMTRVSWSWATGSGGLAQREHLHGTAARPLCP